MDDSYTGYEMSYKNSESYDELVCHGFVCLLGIDPFDEVCCLWILAAGRHQRVRCGNYWLCLVQFYVCTV